MRIKRQASFLLNAQPHVHWQGIASMAWKKSTNSISSVPTRRAGIPLGAIARVIESHAGDLAPLLEERLNELDDEIEHLRDQQRLVAELLAKPDLLANIRIIDKNTWVELLVSSGMSEDDMTRWHVASEHTAPEKHQRLLELLGLPANEIAAIREWSSR